MHKKSGRYAILCISIISVTPVYAEDQSVDLDTRYCKPTLVPVLSPKQSEFCPPAQDGQKAIECEVAWEKEIRRVDEYNSFVRECLRSYHKSGKTLPLGRPLPSSSSTDEGLAGCKELKGHRESCLGEHSVPRVNRQKDGQPDTISLRQLEEAKKRAAEAGKSVESDRAAAQQDVDSVKSHISRDEELRKARRELDRDLRQQEINKAKVRDQMRQGNQDANVTDACSSAIERQKRVFNADRCWVIPDPSTRCHVLCDLPGED